RRAESGRRGSAFQDEKRARDLSERKNRTGPAIAHPVDARAIPMKVEMIPLHRDFHEIGPEDGDAFAANATHAAIDYSIRSRSPQPPRQSLRLRIVVGSVTGIVVPHIMQRKVD